LGSISRVRSGYVAVEYLYAKERQLTVLRQVFMLDPWWSWAVEAQAIDRVHRMGQTEAVEVVRFIIEGSIEEKMLKIQERKKFM